MEMNVASKIGASLLGFVCVLVVGPAFCVVSADVARLLWSYSKALLEYRNFHFTLDTRVTTPIDQKLFD